MMTTEDLLKKFRKNLASTFHELDKFERKKSSKDKVLDALVKLGYANSIVVDFLMKQIESDLKQELKEGEDAEAV